MDEPQKRRYRLISDEEAARMRDLYVNHKLSSVQIGRLMDRDPAIVRRVLHAHAVPVKKLKWDAPLAMRLLAEGVPMAEVVAQVGKDAKSVRQYVTRQRKKSPMR